LHATEAALNARRHNVSDLIANRKEGMWYEYVYGREQNPETLKSTTVDVLWD
jgi:hypothetical protein